MKNLFIFLALFAFSTGKAQNDSLSFFPASNPLIQYTGRIDFSSPATPRFWNPGTYIRIRFRGTSCDIQINDEVLGGDNHNYIEIVLDNQNPKRIKLKSAENNIHIADHLKDIPHNLLIVKNTEANIGWMEFAGIHCQKLLKANRPSRKIECIGNSITCGTGSDTSAFPCGKGQWYDQHNAYLSYGPVTARALNAQYHLTAVSGIGLMHSCCNMDVVMPQVFNKISTRENKIVWDFKKYQPDVVTICLGQNDGVQDSAVFCKTYSDFIRTVRNAYPRAQIITLTSPMAGEPLKKLMIKYIAAVVKFQNRLGDSKVHFYAFSKRYHGGCGGHPTINEHREISGELTVYIKRLMNW